MTVMHEDHLGMGPLYRCAYVLLDGCAKMHLASCTTVRLSSCAHVRFDI